jgi:type I restriction enzyme S subunit
MSSSEWKTVKLIEIVDTQIDNRGRNPDKYLDYSDHPVIDNYLIKNQKYPDMSEVKRYIDKENFESFLRGYLKKDDVLITLVGNGIGNVTMAPSTKSVIVQNTIGLRTNENASNTFLYYLLLFYQDEIKNFNRGTSQPSIKKTDLFNLAIQIPPLQEQKSIAHILSTLDDKIEVNNQINKTLENMAQAIFKQWFVDFEFPNEDGEPYKSSGGEMVESELGLIPKGWEVKDLGEIIDIHDSKRIPLSKKEREKREKIYPYYGAASLMDYVDEYIFDGIYVLLGEDGTVINEDGSPVLQYVWGKFWVNNHAHVLTGKLEDSVNFLYILLKSTNIRSAVTGAVQLKINQKNLCSIKIVLPKDTTLISKYISITDHIFKKYRAASEENEVLTKLRNSLLPKLMSGEIRVPLDEEDDAS